MRKSLAAGIAVNKAFPKNMESNTPSPFTAALREQRNYLQATRQSFCDEKTVVNSHISSKNSAGERAQLLKAFAEENRSLISNARCLTEGVNAKAIDCVSFVDSKKSTVDIVQAAGRAMRQSKETGKLNGYIVLPV